MKFLGTPSASTDLPRLQDVAQGGTLRQQYLKRSGSIAETCDRWRATINLSLTSTTLRMTGITLTKGTVVSNITAYVGSTAATLPLHGWFGLFDSNLSLLAVTADTTTTSWPASTEKTLAIANIASGASSTFTTTYTGLHYLGWNIQASPPCNTVGTAAAAASGVAPIQSGNSTTGQNTPPTFPFTAAALSGLTGIGYMWVG